jgi:prepilin-type N-terminal cleavage/methylation domain-containing protein
MPDTRNRLGRHRSMRGFTLIEMMVTVAIILTVAAMVGFGFGRAKPRMRLNGSAAEFQSLVLSARQNALATGRTTVVMVFPTFQIVNNTGVGRAVIYQDDPGTFFSAAGALNFASFSAATPQGGENLLAVMDVSPTIAIGPSDGRSDTTMPQPFNRVFIDKACTFCAGDRGAIAFNVQGAASFYSANGAPLTVDGGSVSFYTPSEKNPGADNAANATDIRTVAVVAATGAIRVLKKP